MFSLMMHHNNFNEGIHSRNHFTDVNQYISDNLSLSNGTFVIIVYYASVWRYGEGVKTCFLNSLCLMDVCISYLFIKINSSSRHSLKIQNCKMRTIVNTQKGNSMKLGSHIYQFVSNINALKKSCQAQSHLLLSIINLLTKIRLPAKISWHMQHM